jgi:hypothetical protein
MTPTSIAWISLPNTTPVALPNCKGAATMFLCMPSRKTISEYWWGLILPGTDLKDPVLPLLHDILTEQLRIIMSVCQTLTCLCMKSLNDSIFHSKETLTPWLPVGKMGPSSSPYFTFSILLVTLTHILGFVYCSSLPIRMQATN